MAMTEDEFVRKARHLYKDTSEREKRRIENDKWYFHDWIQKAIGWLQVIVGFVQSLCFISTAVCRRSGRADDCIELQTLRRFRDEYLLAKGDSCAREAVAEYYRIAPGACLWIDGQDDAEQIWSELERVVHHVVALIQAGKMEEAYLTYKHGVLGVIPCLLRCRLYERS